MSEIKRPSRGVEWVPRHVLAPHQDGRREYGARDQDFDEEAGGDWSRQMAALLRHKVTLASIALIAASLIWKASFVGRYYFEQDDFQVLDAMRKSGLTWSLLTHIDAGHFFPGVYLTAWLLSRGTLYNWTAASGVVLVMTAAASLAAWRLLRTMLGNRPAILIPLALYLLTPLSFPNYTWWLLPAEAIPLQIALFMSLNAHLHYVWTRRIRHAVVAAAWLLFGLAFFEKSAVIPPLLFAVTAAFIIKRKGLLSASWIAAVQLWKAWLLYFGLLAGYFAVFFFALHSSTAQPKAPASLHAVGTFAWNLVFRTFLPGTLGGPWHWLQLGGTSGASSWPPAILAWMSLVIALVIIVASTLTRSRAWRGWAILAGWIVLADILPVAIGRLASPDWAGLLGISTRYAADATPVLAIVVGLVFWPIADPSEEGVPNPTPQRAFFGGQWKMAAVALVTVFAVGSVWSVQTFQDLTSSTANRSYIANARAALAETPRGTIIFTTLVPSTMMVWLFRPADETSVVLGPLVNRGSQISWTRQPSGTIDQLKIFGADGRLYPASMFGTTTVPRSLRESCFSARKTQLTLRFPAASASYAQFLRLAYLAGPAAAGQAATLTYGTTVRQLTIRPGLNNAYFPVHGSAANVVVQSQSGSALCLGDAVAGFFVPATGPAIPPLASSAGSG